MNLLVQFEKVEELSHGIVDFYTVRLGNKELTEFELFDEKDFPNHSEEMEALYTTIDLIGKKGAKKFFFKEEHAAHALPIVKSEIKEANEDDFGVRLYCIYLNESLVVLLNGDIKTKLNPESCSNVKEHFLRIKKIAILLDKAIANKDLDLSSYFPFTDFELDI